MPLSIKFLPARSRDVLIKELSCINPQTTFKGSVSGGVASLVCATATPMTEQSQLLGCFGAFWQGKDQLDLEFGQQLREREDSLELLQISMQLHYHHSKQPVMSVTD